MYQKPEQSRTGGQYSSAKYTRMAGLPKMSISLGIVSCIVSKILMSRLSKIWPQVLIKDSTKFADMMSNNFFFLLIIFLKMYCLWKTTFLFSIILILKIKLNLKKSHFFPAILYLARLIYLQLL